MVNPQAKNVKTNAEGQHEQDPFQIALANGAPAHVIEKMMPNQLSSSKSSAQSVVPTDSLSFDQLSISTSFGAPQPQATFGGAGGASFGGGMQTPSPTPSAGGFSMGSSGREVRKAKRSNK